MANNYQLIKNGNKMILFIIYMNKFIYDFFHDFFLKTELTCEESPDKFLESEFEEQIPVGP